MAHIGQYKLLSVFLVVALLISIIPVWPTASFAASSTVSATEKPVVFQGRNDQPAGDISISETETAEWSVDTTVTLSIETTGVSFSGVPNVALDGVEAGTPQLLDDSTIVEFAIVSDTGTTENLAISNIKYDIAQNAQPVDVLVSIDATPTISPVPQSIANATIKQPTVKAAVPGAADAFIGRSGQAAGDILLTEQDTATVETGSTITVELLTTGVTFTEPPVIETSTAGLDVTSAEATLTAGNTTASWTVSEESTETGTSLTIQDIALNLTSTATAGDIDVDIAIDSVAVEPDTVAIARAVFPGVSPGPPVVVAPDVITLPFPDVPASHFAFAAISHLKDKNIVNGYPNGLFRPGSNVTRAEFTKMVVLAKGLTLVDTPTASFNDVPTSHWAFRYIETAKAAGIVKGYPGGEFRPDARISRAEIAAMVTRAAGFTTDTTGMTFPDVPASHWAFNEIMTARNNDIIQGFPNGTFRPNNAATRAEAAVMIFNWII